MRRAPFKTFLLLALAAATMTPSAAFGEKKNAQQPRQAPADHPAQAKSRPNAPNAGKAAGPDAKAGPARPTPNPLTTIDRWNAMNPKQRERMMERMNPDRRKQFLDKLQKFNSLPKAEQQLARERYERLSKLPPEEQQVVRRDMARWEKLPPARREAMLEEFSRLRKMSEAERSTYFDSPEFKDKFYPAEQQMIGNLSKVLPVRK